MQEAVIISAVRTPVGRYMGALRDVEAYELGAKVLNSSLEQAGLSSDQVDVVIMGQTYQNGEYVNIGRMSLLKAGWPESIPATTIDSRCCTGLDVVRMASAFIRSGQAEIVVAGGVESMSRAEFYIPGHIKWGIGGEKGMPRGHGHLSMWGIPLYDRIQRARVMSQPEERYGILPSMMAWAETGAKEEKVSRQECDEWALASHQKACNAIDEGKFAQEIVPIEVPLKKGASTFVDTDETPRRDTTLEKLSKLQPVMDGVCTAGNSSTENDGAAAVVIMSRSKAKELGVETLASVSSCSLVGGDPSRAYETVPKAAFKALNTAGVHLQDVELIEIQEAFAAQVLADLRQMEIGPDHYHKINVNGSGISLGHPIGCTGTRVLVSLVHEMRRRGTDLAMEAICGGGGLGIAAILKQE